MDNQSQQEKKSVKKQEISHLEENKVLDLIYSKTPVLTHYSDNLTIGDTWGQPSIQSLCKSKGNDYAGGCITAILTEFLSFRKNALKAGDVPLYADKILSSLPHWSTSDLILCLKNGLNDKYGTNEFPWQWSPDFVKWIKMYEAEKEGFVINKHEEKKKEGAKADQELVSLLPKDLLDKFKKETFIDQKKRDRAHISLNIPNEIIEQGVEAVDAWIEKYNLNKNNK